MEGKKKGRGKKLLKSPSPPADVYVVEAVKDKKIEHGKTLYFIKWKDWPEDTNTWEPKDNLKGCVDLVNAFEKLHEESKGSGSVKEKKEKKVKKRKQSGTVGVGSDSESNYDSEASDSGVVSKRPKESTIDVDVLEEVPEGKVPEELLGVVPITGIMTYLVKWQSAKKDDGDAEEETEPDMCLVKGEVFKQVFPQIVIAFYERNISWLRDARTDEQRTEDLAEAVVASRERKVKDNLQEATTSKKKKKSSDMHLSSSESDSGSGDDKKFELDASAEDD